MTKQELIDYFKDVFELESQLYTYEKIEQEYVQKLTYIGVPRPLKIAFYDKYSKKVVPLSERNAFEIPVVYGDFLEETRKPEWMNTKGYRNALNNASKAHTSYRKALLLLHFIFILIIALLRIFEIVGILGSCLILAIPYFFCLTRVMDYCSPNNSQNAQQQLLNYYYQCAKEESIRIAESEKSLRHHIENERVELVIRPKKNVKELLDKVYSKNIIFPKYRNFAAIAQIYEYLLSGRCDQLEGPYGAYNLYESELRQNIIIDRLDEIIYQLGRLNGTMNTICGAIQETNNLLGKINSTLGRIEANTALTAYNSQCIAHNTRISSQYVL